MKKLAITIIVVAIASISWAQQQPLYSQYAFNGLLLNPAIAGSTEFSPIILTARQQWVGIADAPKTQAISGYTQMGRNDNIGVGGYIYNDKFGPVSRTGIQGIFAYHLKITSKIKLGLGLSVSAFQYKLDESKLNIIDANDVVITGKTETAFVPDANFGAYLYHKKYYIGLTAAQLFQFSVNVGDRSNENKMVRHYYLTGGYLFKLSESFDIEPSILLKTTEQTPIQLDINTKVIYKKNYWFGISYRTEDAVIAMLGLKYNRYSIGYAYDYTLSNLNNYSQGSHEIMIRIDFAKERVGSSLL